MHQTLRQFLETRGGIIIATVAFLSVISLLVASLLGSFGTSKAGAHSRQRLFICAETGAAFEHTLQLGDTIPVESPHSGHATGYEAERCYWTADGQIKPEPTPVLLQTYLDKPAPTFCPECDRLVVRWNPRPRPGQNPPPTQDQLRKIPGAMQAAARIGEE